MYDWLVVGAGLTGATFAERLASQAGQRVLVVDRRGHVAGNAYDEPDSEGVAVQRYGIHVFHTSSERVWSYLSRFTEWRNYTHRVLAHVDGVFVPVPFNLTSLGLLTSSRDGRRMREHLIETFGWDARVPVLKLLEHPDPWVAAAGRLAYQKVFVNYTAKQWGRRPEELDRAVTGRVPIVIGSDDRYFRDTHQGIPAGGYTAMVDRMLDHPGITVATDTPAQDLIGSGVRWRRSVWSGAIDEYFDSCYGSLPYRSLRFEHQLVSAPRFQPAAQVNYPNDHEFTRIVEHAHVAAVMRKRTTVTREYPLAHQPGKTEPYYPVPCPDNARLHHRYQAEGAKLGGQVVFAGRLADYRYYDMDQAVNHALVRFAQLADKDMACARTRTGSAMPL